MAKSSAVASQSAQLGSVLKIGALTGVVAWSCCISAIVLSFLGLSAASAFFANIQKEYHWWLVALAFVFMDIAIYYFMKQYHGSCNFKTIQHNSTPVVAIVLVALIAYFLLQAIFPSLMVLSGMM